MRLGDIGELKKTLAKDGVGADSFWDRTAFQLTDTDIQLFYARCGLEGLRQAAIAAVDQAQAVVIRALFCGELAKGSFAALVLHEPPPEPYMADEFVDGLIKLRPSRRGACVFALEQKLSPDAVMDLLWSQVPALSLTAQSQEIVKVARLTRHVKLPYVFWEWATPSIACPLIGLRTGIEAAFECGITRLQERYDRMVMLNRRAESTSFLDLARQLGRT